MLNNEREYGADVLEFNPDRFLRPASSGKGGVEINPDVRHPATIAFGFGRRYASLLPSLTLKPHSPQHPNLSLSLFRICPGSHIAQSTLWLTAASLLTLFEFDTPACEKANYVSGGRVDERFDPGFLCHPREFGCEFRVRSEEAGVVLGELSLGV